MKQFSEIMIYLCSFVQFAQLFYTFYALHYFSMHFVLCFIMYFLYDYYNNNHWQTQRIHLSVSAVVNSPPKEKCGCLPQQFWLH